MRRPLFALFGGLVVVGAVASGVACQGGVHSEAGNAFPCDFGALPAERDAACAAGWVCGVDDRCRPFVRDEIYFGEYDALTEVPPLPLLDGARAGRLYPLLPDAPVVLAAVEFSGDRSLNVLNVLYAGLDDVYRIDVGNRRYSLGKPIPAGLKPEGLLSFDFPDAGGAARAWLDGAGGKVFVELSFQSPVPLAFTGHVKADGGDLQNALELQHLLPARNEDGTGGLDQLAMIVVALPGGPGSLPRREAGELVLRPTGSQPPLEARYLPFDVAAPDGGAVIVRDARVTSFLKRAAPILLTNDGFYVRCSGRSTPGDGADGGLLASCTPGQGGVERWLHLPIDDFDLRPRELGVSAGGRVWAVLTDALRAGAVRSNLRTFEVTERSTGLEVEEALSACEPCQRGVAVRVTPSSSNGIRADVLCAYKVDGGVRQVVQRVVGVAAGGACEVDSFTPFIDPDGVSSVSTPKNSLVVVGGKRGQLWVGETLSDAYPQFLDRAPSAVTRVEVDGGSRLLALTDRYVALEEPGFGLVPLVQPRAERPVAVVGNSRGLFVLGSADVVRLQPRFTDAGIEAELAFGPQLAAPAGGSAAGPFLAYLIEGQGDVPAHLIATAHDSLYFAEGFTERTPENVSSDPMNALRSALTPEPNFPIRSIAVSDDPARGDASHGYLVTSRNLFEFRLDAQRRWTLNQIPMPAGEPGEVAMQTGDRVYGRVMYRNGAVFTLPSGFELAPPLEVDGGSTRVSDFEHVHGRPFAVTDKGVYVADPGTEKLQPGSSERYVRWSWRPVAYPSDAGFIPGTLHTLREPRDATQDNATLYLFDERGSVFRLLDTPVPRAD